MSMRTPITSKEEDSEGESSRSELESEQNCANKPVGASSVVSSGAIFFWFSIVLNIILLFALIAHKLIKNRVEYRLKWR